MNNRMSQLGGILVLLLLPMLLQAQNQRIENWEADLEQYKSGLEQGHIDLYNQIRANDFEAELEQIRQAVPSQSDWEITLALMRLTRKIGDGHTAISLRNQQTHYYPFHLRFISGAWRIVKVSQDYEYLLGQTLTSVDGHPISEVEAQLRPLVQFVENPNSILFRTGDYLPISELLYSLHICSQEQIATFGFIDDEGKRSELELQAIPQANYFDDHQFKKLWISIPERQKLITTPNQPLSWGILEGTKAMYIEFPSYPDFESMEQTATEIYSQIMRDQCKQLIIDLRGNSGGDLYVGLFLAYALNLADSIDWKQGVFLLTDQYTYSAAASNAALFRQLLNARVVGMPTGSNPHGYQDMSEFDLPNSKLIVGYSKRKFRLQEKPDTALEPDVKIPHEWTAYRENRDVMLEWIYKEIKSAE